MRIDTSLYIYQKALLKNLGPDYRKQLFDLEQVIYRDLGTYDIEISGGHRKKEPFAIYVWLKEWPRIVERHLRLAHDHKMLKALLDDIVKRYSNMPVEESVSHMPEEVREVILRYYSSKKAANTDNIVVLYQRKTNQYVVKKFAAD